MIFLLKTIKNPANQIFISEIFYKIFPCITERYLWVYLFFKYEDILYLFFQVKRQRWWQVPGWVELSTFWQFHWSLSKTPILPRRKEKVFSDWLVGLSRPLYLERQSINCYCCWNPFIFIVVGCQPYIFGVDIFWEKPFSTTDSYLLRLSLFAQVGKITAFPLS